MPSTGYGINVPITPQTDPRKQPDYKFVEFPKMMLQAVDKAYVEAWRERNVNPESLATGRVTYNGVAPRLGSQQPVIATEDDVINGWAKAVGEPVIVQSPHEEREFRKSRGAQEVASKPATVEVQAGPGDDEDGAAALRAENAKLKALLNKPAAATAKAAKAKPAKKAKRRIVETVSELPED